jgi:hypothetical protein
MTNGLTGYKTVLEAVLFSADCGDHSVPHRAVQGRPKNVKDGGLSGLSLRKILTCAGSVAIR